MSECQSDTCQNLHLEFGNLWFGGQRCNDRHDKPNFNSRWCHARGACHEEEMKDIRPLRLFSTSPLSQCNMPRNPNEPSASLPIEFSNVSFSYPSRPSYTPKLQSSKPSNGAVFHMFTVRTNLHLAYTLGQSNQLF